jgi:transposase-like protein
LVSISRGQSPRRIGELTIKVHKYVIELTDEERNSLRRLVRSGDTKRRIADRARIVLWADEKVTIDESAQRLGVHRETILYWRERFLVRRLEGIPECLQDLPRSGRPPVFSPSGGGSGQGGCV